MIGTNMHVIDALMSDASTKHICAPSEVNFGNTAL